MESASLRVGFESEEWQFMKHPTLACLFAHTVPVQMVESSGWIPASFRRQFHILGMQGEVRLLRNIFGLTVLDILQDAAERVPGCHEVEDLEEVHGPSTSIKLAPYVAFEGVSFGETIFVSGVPSLAPAGIFCS